MKRAKNLFEPLISDENLSRAIDEVNRTHHWRTHHRPNKCTAWVEETKEERIKELMLNTGVLAKDMGSILIGEEAVKEGIIDEVGGIRDAFDKLYELIKEKKKKND